MNSRLRDAARYFLFFLRGHPVAMLGFGLLSLQILVIVLAPLIATHPPELAISEDFLQPPNQVHWLGTDNSGMDIYSRVIYGARTDLTVAVTGVLLAMLIGCPLGAIVGYYRGWIVEAIMRLMDFLQSFPIFILAMALVSVTAQQMSNVIYVISFLNIPIFVRLMRAEILSLRESEFVEAAQCVGNSDARIIFKHLLPNAMGSAFAQASISIGWAILITAGLSFIGAGLKIPAAEWGLMISIGSQNMVTGQWWPSFFPGMAIMISVLSFALVGDALQKIYDPTKRR